MTQQKIHDEKNYGVESLLGQKFSIIIAFMFSIMKAIIITEI